MSRARAGRLTAAFAGRSFDWQTWAPLALLLLGGLLVRLWAMRWPPFETDMNSWIGWGERIRTVGPAGFYSDDIFADYAPGYVYVMWLTALVRHTLFAGVEGFEIYHFLYRLTPVLCDLVIAAVIFAFVRRAVLGSLGWTPDRALVLALGGAACYAFNPAVILNSATWGQVDSTFTLAMLVAVVLLLRGQPEWGGVAYAVSFMIKPQAAALAPLIIVLLLVRYPPRRAAPSIALGAVVGYLIILPFFGLDAPLDLVALLRRSTDVYAYTSLFTYNLWGIYGFWLNDGVPGLFGLPLRTLGLMIYIVGLVYGVAAYVQQLRRGTDPAYTTFMFGAFFLTLPVMVLTRMHERYLYPALAFMLVFALLALGGRALRRGEPYGARFLVAPLVLFAATTVLHTLNLYQVYEYYQFFNLGGVPATNEFFYNVADSARVWSVLSLLTFTTFVVLMTEWLPSIDAPAESSEAAPATRGEAPRPEEGQAAL
jgi:dolichyl-phosphate-mannose-protein mannosyltransferase